MKKETGKEWLHGRRKRIAVVVVLAAAGAIAWLLLSLFSGAKKWGSSRCRKMNFRKRSHRISFRNTRLWNVHWRAASTMIFYVIVTRGEKPTSGFKVAVDHMALEEQDGKSTRSCMPDLKILIKRLLFLRS